MKQTYEIILDLIKSERNYHFQLNVNYRLGELKIAVEDRLHELENQERAFICTMIAYNVSSKSKQLSYKMNSQWFMSKNTYYKVRQQLIDKHVICKHGNKHRYVLNPDFDVSYTKDGLKELERELSFELNNQYQEYVKVSSLRQVP